jgi:hypothetical protein
MSRGLGNVQRMILAVLTTRPGSDWVRTPRGEYARDRYECGFQLKPGWHDLSQVKKLMAEAQGLSPYKRGWNVWHANFSRAARGLAQNGYLEWLNSSFASRYRFVSLSVKPARLTLKDLEQAKLWNQLADDKAIKHEQRLSSFVDRHVTR